MIFKCWDINTRSLVHEYVEGADHHKCALLQFGNTDMYCACGSNRYVVRKYIPAKGLVFAFCFDDIRVRKQAVFFTRHAIEMYLTMQPILTEKQLAYEAVVKASIHNTRNLNSQITGKYTRSIREDDLAKAKDKLVFIEGVLKNNLKQASRDVLSILRISKQISAEYNVVDYLRPGVKLAKSEFGNHDLHSCLVLSFYLLEEDFYQKNIRVNTKPVYESVYVNYNTMQTVFIHLYDNALKYCRPGSTVTIEAFTSADVIEVRLTMDSLYLTDDILAKALIGGHRGDQAKRKHPKGTGLGLGIVKALVELNKGTFAISRLRDEVIKEDGFDYSHNRITLRLLRREFF